MCSAYRVVSDHYAASSRRDLIGVLADMDERTEWTKMAGFPLTSTYAGAVAIGAGAFQVLQRGWEGFRVKIERPIDGGDSVVAVGWYVAAYCYSDKSFGVRVAHAWAMEDGRIRHFEQFCDTLLMERATR